MRVFCLVVFLAVLVLRVAADTPADAADPAYLGTWKFAGAVVAPWANDRLKPDAAERARLMGKTIVFQSKAIDGPPPFACRRPQYQLKDFTSDMLFEGAFDEMRSKDKAVDTGKLAAKLGFAGNNIRTLETGCDFDFHFVDAATAQVGLNNTVYTLKKQ